MEGRAGLRQSELARRTVQQPGTERGLQLLDAPAFLQAGRDAMRETESELRVGFNDTVADVRDATTPREPASTTPESPADGRRDD